MKKFLAVFITLVIIGLIGWRIYTKVSVSGKPENKTRRVSAVGVEVVPVRKADIRDIGLFTGTLLPRAKFIVAPKISGRLEKLLVNVGDKVKRGQLIAVLEDDEYLQQVNQAQAELDVVKARLEESMSNLDIARREFDRARVLREKKIASASELDATEAQFKTEKAKHKVAVAQVAEKEAALRAVRVRLSYTRIHANWEDGSEHRVVGERFRDEGAMLSSNTSIVSILDIDTLIGVIHIIERDYSKIRVDQKAIITTDAFPGKTFSGRIIRIAPLLKETSRQARVELEIPNPKGILKPGMFVRAQIEFAIHKDVIVIPLTALARRNGQQGVFIADRQEMTAHFLPLTLGIVDKEWAEVLKPPLNGWVITLGQHLLGEGSPIVIQEAESRVPSQRIPDTKKLKKRKPTSSRKKS